MPTHQSIGQQKTVLEYIEQIIILCVKEYKQLYKNEKQAAFIVIDNFEGQNTDAVFQVQEASSIQVCPLPPNTTKHLQLMDQPNRK